MAAAEAMATDGNTLDFYPVVKFFMPDGAATWRLSEADPTDPDIAFGLCDLGFGTPELGSVRIGEIASVRGPLPLPTSLLAFEQKIETPGCRVQETWRAAAQVPNTSTEFKLPRMNSFRSQKTEFDLSLSISTGPLCICAPQLAAFS